MDSVLPVGGGATPASPSHERGARFRRVARGAIDDNGRMGSARTPGVRGRTSRLGGEQAVLGAAVDAPARQLGLDLAAEPVRTAIEPRPGVVHVPDWLDLDAQRALVAEFREWARRRPGCATRACRPAT